ncbi:MAG: hypothetical protein MH252_16220 [Thermosynechococcaceae cyanobacterium MS004]|nr:hypothetical protein [Thermosynechococcaceae cyanobacterium MS004]
MASCLLSPQKNGVRIQSAAMLRSPPKQTATIKQIHGYLLRRAIALPLDLVG